MPTRPGPGPLGLGIVLLAAVCARAETSPCPAGSGYGDVALVEGAALCSTADAAQRARILELARAAARVHSPRPIQVDYPAEGAVFPPAFAPPTMLWHDDASGADAWLVEIRVGGSGARLLALVAGEPPPRGEIDEACIAPTNKIHEPTPYQASARSWRPSPELWAEVQRRSRGGNAAVSVHGYRRDDPREVVSSGSVTIHTSADAVGATIFYRDVPLMPSAGEEGVIKPLDQRAQPLIKWRLRDVARPESRVLLERLPSCANCHSFSDDGKTLGMDIDGPGGDKGAYALVPIAPEVIIRDADVMTWNAFAGKPPGLNTLGFMSRVSPDGKRVVSTVNEAVYVRNFWDYRFCQVFFPTRGILAWYSRESREIRALPGADAAEFVHCSPAWSPDGETIVFSRARARDPYERGRPLATHANDPNETQIQYDLWRIPFNDGRGGIPQPIAGASDNGMSNSFPKVSPDGKWVVFTRAKNGLLMRPDSELWVVPIEGGEARPLESNLPLMNSWHSFSPNGRWLVFSSKSNTPYTQMFLTHFDEEGRTTPPILIENATAANRAVNIPEFVNVGYDDFTLISVPAVNHYEHLHRGNALAREGRFAEAAAELQRALEGEPQEWRVTEWRIHDSLSKVLLQLGQSELALEHVKKSLELNPYNAEMQANYGYLLLERGQAQEALGRFDLAVRMMPSDAKARFNRGAVRLQLGDREGALEDFDATIDRAPGFADARVARGMLLVEEGRAREALEDLDLAVEANPSNPTARYFRALARTGEGDRAGALEDIRQALAVAPPTWPRRADLEALRGEIEAGEASRNAD